MPASLLPLGWVHLKVTVSQVVAKPTELGGRGRPGIWKDKLEPECWGREWATSWSPSLEIILQAKGESELVRPDPSKQPGMSWRFPLSQPSEGLYFLCPWVSL